MVLILTLAALCAQMPVAANPVMQPRTGEIRVVEVSATPEMLDALARTYIVANVTNGDDGTKLITIYATEAEVAALRAAGYQPVDVTPAHAKASPEGYITYPELTATLQALTAAHPGTCRLQSIGKSAENRDLWTLVVSRNPDIEEDEPECKLLSTIHGDEPIGTELLVRLAQWLLSNDGADARATALLDTTELWLMPLVNPDGYARTSRFNAAGHDLNRSFPAYGDDFTGTWYGGDASGIEGRPVEVGHLMTWILTHSFTLSACFHSGATVVNYPYDDDGMASGTPAPSPDEALFRVMSRAYSIHNPAMWNSTVFDDGITNGADWYVITGGMQDWNYRYAGCNDVTIELSDTKRPPASQLDNFWEANRESMLAYLETANRGIRGIVTDRATGEPLWAEVRVEGNAHAVYTDPDVGDYHRMLTPGAYTLRVSAPNHVGYTQAGVNVGTGAAARVDIALGSADINQDGNVNALDIQYVINAILERPVPYNCDVDGGGVTSTDLQLVINVVLD